MLKMQLNIYVKRIKISFVVVLPAHHPLNISDIDDVDWGVKEFFLNVNFIAVRVGWSLHQHIRKKYVFFTSSL